VVWAQALRCVGVWQVQGAGVACSEGALGAARGGAQKGVSRRRQEDGEVCGAIHPVQAVSARCAAAAEARRRSSTAASAVRRRMALDQPAAECTSAA